MIAGRDIICQAQSGMGKTAAFCISILQRLDPNDPMGKGLVLAPTRELAEQILEEFRAFAKYMSLKCIPCIGGVGNFKENVKDVGSGNFHVAVGTLGRICHLLHPNPRVNGEPGLNGASIKMFVIDEADKMVMDPSYTRDLNYILEMVSPNAQMIVTSATMPSPAFDECNGIMQNPFTFLLRNEQLTLDGIRQFHIRVGNNDGKLSTMDELFPFLKKARGITFCNTRNRAETLARKMKGRNHTVDGMTGTMEQHVRKDLLKAFKSGVVPVLIASDLLGRGVDIHHVQLVINYDLPEKTEEYIHRIGRAGRYGKKGLALTFVTDAEVAAGKIKVLEEFYQTVIPELRARIGDLMNELN